MVNNAVLGRDRKKDNPRQTDHTNNNLDNRL